MQTISLGISVCQFRIDFRLPKRFTSHLKEANEVVMLAGMTGYFDDFSEVGWIFSLDIGFCKKCEDEFKKYNMLSTNGFFDAQTIQLSLGQSALHLRPLDLVGKVQGTINRHNMFDENVNCHSMLIVLVDC